MIIGIELGGTKINISYGDAPDTLGEMIRIETTTPVETLGNVNIAVKQLIGRYPEAKGIGIASFGPVDVNPRSVNFGKILDTPKPAWSNTSIIDGLKESFPNLPIRLDTDVNAAALSEQYWGKGVGKENIAYVTVGTGIGIGLIVNNKCIHGTMHPEAGHILVRRHPKDVYKGFCVFHSDCLEGMACGPSIMARYGKSASNFDASHEIWDFIGYYLGQLCYSLILTNAVEKIIIGGGVGLNQHLLPKVHEHCFDLLSNYLPHYRELQNIRDLITTPALGDKAGVLGAIALFND
jgi:fructokinase